MGSPGRCPSWRNVPSQLGLVCRVPLSAVTFVIYFVAYLLSWLPITRRFNLCCLATRHSSAQEEAAGGSSWGADRAALRRTLSCFEEYVTKAALYAPFMGHYKRTVAIVLLSRHGFRMTDQKRG
ncbi:hypothetical protein IG631_00152 [Alternaria alternata]|nr:hypothetical protein IG631_00152 [Alternaria alternata]